MKYSEFHRLVKRNGWSFLNAVGSPYFYEKDGIKSSPVHFHGAKEMGEGLRKKIIKDMNLK